MKPRALLVPLLLTASLTASFAAPSTARAQAEAHATVAVMNFTGGSVTHAAANKGVGQGIADLLTESLASRGDIRVVDRARFNEVLAEQKLAETNQVDPATAVRLGKVLGVRHMITGGYLVDGRNRVRFDVRAIDVETSEIELRETIEGKVDDLLSLVDQMEQRLSKSLASTSVVRQAGRPAPPSVARQAQAKAIIDSLSARRP